MKRKYKIWYELSSPYLWWCGKEVGWIHTDILNNSQFKTACTSRTFRTAERAFTHIKGMPSGSVLCRWSYKRGRRRYHEWEKK